MGNVSQLRAICMNIPAGEGGGSVRRGCQAIATVSNGANIIVSHIGFLMNPLTLRKVLGCLRFSCMFTEREHLLRGGDPHH
ncbi:hypothetical protein Y032_0056g2669 [Ancylostoma ceylanicum]|uniref:Uncharacterized protein n=1 Tax=Ancylostoma ceylanicum TaxID=53326 RepID=A0A016U562_9BILA|nr:hypothetical protein Y032_0056g2669 [Ancylostoma ceylanicum]